GEFVVGDRTQSPPLAKWVSQPIAPIHGNNTESSTSPRDSKVAARSLASNGLVAVVVEPIAEGASSSMIWTLLVFFGVVVSWGQRCAYLLPLTAVTPPPG